MLLDVVLASGRERIIGGEQLIQADVVIFRRQIACHEPAGIYIESFRQQIAFILFCYINTIQIVANVAFADSAET